MSIIGKRGIIRFLARIAPYYRPLVWLFRPIIIVILRDFLVYFSFFLPYYRFYYILTHFIAKSNALLHFDRKNQCVSLFETKTKVFSQTTNQVLPTSCRVQVWTYSSSLLPKKSDFQRTFLGILPKFSKENLSSFITWFYIIFP